MELRGVEPLTSYMRSKAKPRFFAPKLQITQLLLSICKLHYVSALLLCMYTNLYKKILFVSFLLDNDIKICYNIYRNKEHRAKPRRKGVIAMKKTYVKVKLNSEFINSEEEARELAETIRDKFDRFDRVTIASYSQTTSENVGDLGKEIVIYGEDAEDEE